MAGKQNLNKYYFLNMEELDLNSMVNRYVIHVFLALCFCILFTSLVDLFDRALTFYYSIMHCVYIIYI